MGLAKYTTYRVVNAIIILFLVLLITAFIMNQYMEDTIKADIEMMIQQQVFKNPEYGHLSIEEKEKIAQEKREFYYAKYGLNQPYIIRVFYRAYDALTFNFGRAITLRSSTGSAKVMDIIIEALPRTILLFTTGTIITIIIGIILGMKSAVKVGSLFDRTISTFALFTYSLPMWWTGMLFILFFSYQLGIFPSGGMVSTPPPEGFAYYIDVLWHMSLPLITYVFVNFGGWAYMTRSIVTNIMTEDFVITAKAKGVPERKILYGHVFRTASPPIVTSMVLSIIWSLGGAIITEAVFSWPGLGRLYWMAISSGDMPVVLGLVYVTTFLYVFAVLILDFIYGLLDPRVKVGVRG